MVAWAELPADMAGPGDMAGPADMAGEVLLSYLRARCVPVDVSYLIAAFSTPPGSVEIQSGDSHYVPSPGKHCLVQSL